MEAFFNQLPQQFVNGLTLGAVYALIALGYSMVYGILQLLNFAHGDVYMIGAFVGYGVMTALTPKSGLLLPAWAIILAMLLAAQLTLSANYRTVKTELLLPPRLGVDLGPARLSAVRLLVIVTAILLMVALNVLVRRTRLGRAMRAVAIDREAAAMMGVDVDRVIVMTFFISSALAGAAGVLVGLAYTQVWHLMGFTAGLKGFTAAVVGGIGNIPGAMLGGLLLGLAESLAGGFISTTYKDLIAFIVLVLVLLVRPTGLLGAKILQKV